MFTGIVTDVGRVVAIERGGDTTFTIETDYDPATIDVGASIAHSGVCLTVVGRSGQRYAIQASAETLSKTTLGTWQVGTEVNLERSLRLGDELGGHLVFGHVDTVARVADRTPEGDSVRFVFEAPIRLAPYFAP
ncbi:MAG: riboflavin synthase, partial [Alphaproteobacteria bacterium]|nr:riboflavin synthase [Alphaproteobacteria bacterium]